MTEEVANLRVRRRARVVRVGTGRIERAVWRVWRWMVVIKNRAVVAVRLVDWRCERGPSPQAIGNRVAGSRGTRPVRLCGREPASEWSPFVLEDEPVSVLRCR